jgi:hypothetical protein
MIDSSVGGRGKGVWTADNQNVAATYFLVYSPTGRPVPAQSNPELSLQIGNFNPDGSQNTTGSPAGNNVPNLAQMVVLNYMALHGPNAIAQWPTLYPGPGMTGLNLVNTLGSGTALEPETTLFAVCGAAYADAPFTVSPAARVRTPLRAALPISTNVRHVIQKSSKAAGCRVDTTARIVRFCIRSDQGKLAERRGRKASGLRGVPRTAGLPA